MERTFFPAHRRRLIFVAAGAAAAAFLLRRVLVALGMQLLAASVLAAAAQPLCRLLEKKLPGGVSAALALLLLLAGLALIVVVTLPAAAAQFGVLAEALPSLADVLQSRAAQFTAWLTARGIDLLPLREGILVRLTEIAGGFVSRLMGVVTGFVGSISKVLLSPLAAFYLLRDRRRIFAWLTLLLPVKHRAQGVRAAREMKRETAAFLRGQLLLSLAVGAMTAAALAVLGVPGWLLLGLLMGVMELIPYIGPVIAGVPAVLLALQFGWNKALWTLAVLVVIQEIEGLILSPRLVGNATAMHPLTVLLLVSAGGMLGGTLGMAAVIPLVVSIRGAARGWRE